MQGLGCGWTGDLGLVSPLRTIDACFRRPVAAVPCTDRVRSLFTGIAFTKETFSEVQRQRRQPGLSACAGSRVPRVKLHLP